MRGRLQMILEKHQFIYLLYDLMQRIC